MEGKATHAPAFSKLLGSDLPYRAIATLADEPTGLTCSVIVGTMWASGGSQKTRLLGYASFEQAAETVAMGENDALLVPGAYPDISSLFFHQQLTATTTFLATLPDIVLCYSTDASPFRLFERLYYHPATASLLSQVTISYAQKKPVISNSKAARLAARGNGMSAAITNRACAEHYGLKIMQTLAVGTRMGFVVFTKKRNGPRQN